MLHGVSLELGEGTLTALVGESGSGKSTLAKLLVHYYDISGGRITLGGQDITDMSIEALNDNISYVSQEQFLFNTTLYENILICKPDATREEVLRLPKKHSAMSFSNAFRTVSTQRRATAVSSFRVVKGSVSRLQERYSKTHPLPI